MPFSRWPLSFLPPVLPRRTMSCGPSWSRLVLVLLMFCGACAGLHRRRHQMLPGCCMLLRAIRREIHQIAHPRSVEVVKLDGKVAEESTVHSVLVFVGCYGLILLGAALWYRWTRCHLTCPSLPRSPA